VLLRFCAVLTLFSLIVPLRGQDDEVIHMVPEFPLTFPLLQQGKTITVKFPVLVNPTTVIKPGTQLRVMYMLNQPDSDSSADLVLAHKGNMEQSYSRDTMSSEDKSKMPSELAHELEGYRRTVWDLPNNFILSMAQYPTDTLHLMYSTTGQTADVADANFSFFDGLMIGLPDGKVTVLAVEKESRADQAGLKAGDEILAVGNILTQNDLSKFSLAYATAKAKAKDDEATTYSMTIRVPGKTETQTVNIPMPESFRNGLMNGL